MKGLDLRIKSLHSFDMIDDDSFYASNMQVHKKQHDPYLSQGKPADISSTYEVRLICMACVVKALYRISEKEGEEP